VRRFAASPLRRRDPTQRAARSAGRGKQWFALLCRSAWLSLFGGTATIVPASGLRFNVSGRWASEHDVVSLPVGLRFNVSRR